MRTITRLTAPILVAAFAAACTGGARRRPPPPPMHPRRPAPEAPTRCHRGPERGHRHAGPAHPRPSRSRPPAS